MRNVQKKQMVKLQLILNEIRVKMSKHRLPNVSQKYKDDLHKGEDMLKDMQIVLDHSPLDVKQLNGLLKMQLIIFIHYIMMSII